MTNNGFNFGTVSRDDTTALTALRTKFFQSQIDAGLLDIPTDRAASLDRTTTAIMRGGRSQCIVAKNEGIIVAYIYFVLRTVPGMTKSSIGSVEEIFVDPSVKRQGLANQLVKQAVAQMRSLGAERIQARVLAANDPAVQFWDKEGFVENVRIIEYPLDEM